MVGDMKNNKKLTVHTRMIRKLLIKIKQQKKWAISDFQYDHTKT